MGRSAFWVVKQYPVVVLIMILWKFDSGLDFDADKDYPCLLFVVICTKEFLNS